MRYITALFFLFFLSAFSTLPHIVKTADISVSSSREVYVVSHGWHTAFVVPAHIITAQIPQLRERFSGALFIEFSWGDKGFYQAEEITSGLIVQAIFWPTESVVHAVAVPESPLNYFSGSQVETVCLQKEEYSRLIRFIENSFHKDNGGKIMPLNSGIYGDSQFYKGEGDYYLMNTCNKWTAKGLSSAGMDISTTFKLTAGSVMGYLSDQKSMLTSNSGRCEVSSGQYTD